MKGLIIYIRREKLEAVQKVLHQRNVAGFSVENVEGCGCQKSQIDLENIPFFPTLEPESQLTPKLRGLEMENFSLPRLKMPSVSEPKNMAILHCKNR